MANQPLWTSTLNPSGPAYGDLKEIFQDGAIPLIAPAPVLRDGPHGRMSFYQVDVTQLSEPQLAKVVAFVAGKFNLDPALVRKDLLSEHGFPVREENVIVAYSLRAFI